MEWKTFVTAMGIAFPTAAAAARAGRCDRESSDFAAGDVPRDPPRQGVAADPLDELLIVSPLV
jgi:hypothetical protein